MALYALRRRQPAGQSDGGEASFFDEHEQGKDALTRRRGRLREDAAAGGPGLAQRADRPGEGHARTRGAEGSAPACVYEVKEVLATGYTVDSLSVRHQFLISNPT